MKFGVRTPSIKKSIKARTTGRAKRAVKRSINPIYGKKGTGFINNPKKAVYNKVYNKTSIDLLKPIKKSYSNKTIINGETYNVEVKVKDISYQNNDIKTKKVNKWISWILCFYLGYFGVHKFYEGDNKMGIIYLCTIGLFGIGWIIDLIMILTKPNPYYVEIK